MKNYFLLALTLILFQVAETNAQKRKIKKVYKAEYIPATVTPGGFIYELYKTGSGEVAKNGDKVYFEMIIRHQDSILEDSRRMRQKPEFVIPDIDESPNPVIDGLRLSRLGDSIVVHERIDTVRDLPPQMAGWREITYHVKIKKIISLERRKEIMMRQPDIEIVVADDIKKYNDKSYSRTIQTQSGVQCFIHEEGNGPVPVNGESIEIYYHGVALSNGKKFDSSFDEGFPFTVQIGGHQVILGLEEALSILKKGTKATLFIPASSAYGDQGIEDLIDPNSDLVFYIELLK